jgi:hypothetical protein
MLHRGNQQMAVYIREFIHHYNGIFPFMQYKPVFFTCAVITGAEDAAGLFAFCQYVFHPPGGPEHFHFSLLKSFRY